MLESIQLINKESLIEQRERLLTALRETEEMLRVLGWEEPGEVDLKSQAGVIRRRKRKRGVQIKRSKETKSLRGLAREACKSLKVNITRNTVAEYIRANHPNFDLNEASLGATLSGLKGKEIEEVSKGSGGNPSIFRYLGT